MKKNKQELVFALTVAVLFFILAAVIFSGLTDRLDAWVYSRFAVIITPGLTWLNKSLSFIGDAYLILPVCAVLLALKATRRIAGIPLSLTAGISYLANESLKHIFKRPRPTLNQLIPISGYSFPSGHAMNNMAFYTALALIIIRLAGGGHKKTALLISVYSLVLAIGFSRIYLGVHYATDVLGGFLMGFSAALAVDWTLNKLKDMTPEP